MPWQEGLRLLSQASYSTHRLIRERRPDDAACSRVPKAHGHEDSKDHLVEADGSALIEPPATGIAASSYLFTREGGDQLSLSAVSLGIENAWI